MKTWASLGTLIGSAVASDPQAEAKLRSLLKSAVTDREWKVLELRLGLNGKSPKTLRQAALNLDVTGERIRQIETKALLKIRDRLIRHTYNRKAFESLVERYAPSVDKLLKQFRKTCNRMTYSETQAVAHTFGAPESMVWGWRSGDDMPKLQIILSIIQWEDQGKPIDKTKTVPENQYARPISIMAAPVIQSKPYAGIFCDICGERVKQQDKGRHIVAKHPAYQIKRVEVEKGLPNRGGLWGNSYMVYECGFCGCRIGGPAAMVRHVQESHADVVTNQGA